MFQDAKTIYNAIALEYDAYRPTYPQEAIQFLLDLAHLDGSNTIADIGTGTGRIALALAQHVRLLYAVDTADQMLEQLRESALRLGLSNIHAIEAPGERTGFHAQSLDFAVLSQVFHWMDRPLVLREMHRVLKPNAPIAILWNEVTNNTDPYHIEIQELIKQYNTSYKGGLDILGQHFPEAINSSGLFSPAKTTTFPFTMHYAKESFIGYLLSKSYIGAGIARAKLPKFMQEAHEILHQHFGTGKVTEHYQTVILAARSVGSGESTSDDL